MNQKYFPIFYILLLTLVSCNKDILYPNDYRGPGEIKDNEMTLSKNTVLLDEMLSKDIINIFNGRIIITKQSALIQKIKPGTILFKNALVGTDTIAFYRKVLEIRERANDFALITEAVGLTDAFYRYTIDTRSDIFTVRPRIDWNEYVEIKTPIGDVTRNFHFDPEINLNMSYKNFFFTSSFDSSDIVNGTISPPSYHFHIEDFNINLEGSFKLDASANLSLDTTIKQPTMITSIPEFGLALFYEVTLGITGSLSGEIESPIETITFGDYDIDFMSSSALSSPTYSFAQNPPRPENYSNNEWIIKTDGNVEVRLGVNFFIGVIGAPTLAKLGVSLSGYFNPGIHHVGDLINPRPGYDLNFEAGIVGNVFAEAELFDYLNLNYAGPDVKFPLLKGYTFIPTCEGFDDIMFNFNTTTQDFDVRVGNSDPTRNFYNININGVPISHMGNPTFDYNKNYIVQIPISNLPVNEIIIYDNFATSCYIKGSFVNPNGFGSCNEILFDNEGNDYCTTTIGNSTWMAENLRLTTAGVPVKSPGSPDDRLYGRLYTFDEIMNGSSGSSQTNNTYIQGLCPNGWHIPTQNDWDNLIFELGGSEMAGLNMKYPSNALWGGNVPNHGTFNAVPAGEYYTWQNLYGFENKKAFFWSSQVGPLGEIYFYSVSEHFDDIIEDFGFGQLGHSIKEIGYSCRCVKDE